MKLSCLSGIVEGGEVEFLNTSITDKIIENTLFYSLWCLSSQQVLVSQNLEAEAVCPNEEKILKLSKLTDFSEI